MLFFFFIFLIFPAARHIHGNSLVLPLLRLVITLVINRHKFNWDAFYSFPHIPLIPTTPVLQFYLLTPSLSTHHHISGHLINPRGCFENPAILFHSIHDVPPLYPSIFFISLLPIPDASQKLTLDIANQRFSLYFFFPAMLPCVISIAMSIR